jgi:hypothetical protein
MFSCVLDVLPSDIKRVRYDKDKDGFAVVLKKGKPWKTAGTPDKSQVLVPMLPISPEMLCSLGDCVRYAEARGMKSCALVVERGKDRLGFVAV